MPPAQHRADSRGLVEGVRFLLESQGPGGGQAAGTAPLCCWAASARAKGLKGERLPVGVERQAKFRHPYVVRGVRAWADAFK